MSVEALNIYEAYDAFEARAVDWRAKTPAASRDAGAADDYRGASGANGTRDARYGRLAIVY